MHNSTCYHPQTFLSLAPLRNPLGHGRATLPWLKDLCGVMFLFHASTSLSLFLLLLHISSIILTKLFAFLYAKAISCRDLELNNDDYKFEVEKPADECYGREDLVADVLGGDTLLFFYHESVENDTLLVDEVRDSKVVVSLEEEDCTFVAESAYCSPLEDLAHDQKFVFEYNDSSIPNTNPTLDCQEDFEKEEEEGAAEENQPRVVEEKKDASEDERVLSIKSFHVHGEKLRVVEEEEAHDDRENFGGSLTGESTSKSSVEWRSSTIFRDSETEYPFSSSSRRSSSRWESYTVFPRYNEGMLFLDRISAQKLSETESLRSIKVQPRSVSERIYHRLTTKPKSRTMGRRDPYKELECAYAAQICLAWEALNWNYTNFRQKSFNRDAKSYGCPARVAQQFQQFQVLLQRFIENEPYEYGRRPEVYSRRRISSPILLQVPEFQESEGEEEKGDASSRISSAEFLIILEDCIKTFMNFLKADKEKCGDILKAFIKKKGNSVDPTFLRFLKKANKRKKMRLKDIGRRHRCIRKKKLTADQEMEILMGLIDLKVVSRVLRMADISDEQLHWCEEKMSRVRVWDGKMQRDSSPLFFPVH